MSESVKTESEMKLDAIVDRLKSEGNVVVYCLARYDANVAFSTRITYPDGVIPDGFVLSLLTNFNWMEPMEYNGELYCLVSKLIEEGWNVIIGYTPGRLVDSPIINGTAEVWVQSSDDARVSSEHARLDMIREITVSWSNAAHKAQLVWKV